MNAGSSLQRATSIHKCSMAHACVSDRAQILYTTRHIPYTTRHIPHTTRQFDTLPANSTHYARWCVPLQYLQSVDRVAFDTPEIHQKSDFSLWRPFLKVNFHIVKHDNTRFVGYVAHLDRKVNLAVSRKETVLVWNILENGFDTKAYMRTTKQSS